MIARNSNSKRKNERERERERERESGGKTDRREESLNDASADWRAILQQAVLLQSQHEAEFKFARLRKTPAQPN